MIKITMILEQRGGAMMTIHVDTTSENPTIPEGMAFYEISKDITQMVKKMSEAADSSVYAEGDSATSLLRMLDKKKAADERR